MSTVESIAAKYGHKLQNDALSKKEVMTNLKSNIERVDPYKLPFGGIAILEHSIEDVKIKMKQLAGLEKELKDKIALVESKVAKMSPEDRKIAKMVRNQYKMKSKIKGL